MKLKFRLGDVVRFRTSGYEVADLNIENASPAPYAQGVVNGKAQDGYVPLYCERENREATTIFVAISNVLEVK